MKTYRKIVFGCALLFVMCARTASAFAETILDRLVYNRKEARTTLSGTIKAINSGTERRWHYERAAQSKLCCIRLWRRITRIFLPN